MISGTFLANPVTPWSEAHAQSALTRQLRGTASVAFAAAAGASCDIGSTQTGILSITIAGAEGAATTTMSCCPPRTYPRVAHYTRQLTVPHAALPSSKTRRKSGGDGDDLDGGDGGMFSGGGDNGFGGGGGDNEGSSDGDSRGRWLQDVLLLWSVFCAWSTWHVLHHVTRQKPESPAFAAVTYSRLNSSQHSIRLMTS